MAANSFAPFNLTTGFDSLGDRHTDTHRPWGLGRNAGKGPDFLSVDMRLTRAFPLSEAVSLQVIGEVFNLLNRTNFKTVNGVVGNASIENLPANLVGRRGPVTEPLSFASAFDPQQFQFTLRLTFLETAAWFHYVERSPPEGDCAHLPQLPLFYFALPSTSPDTSVGGASQVHPNSGRPVCRRCETVWRYYFQWQYRFAMAES